MKKWLVAASVYMCIGQAFSAPLEGQKTIFLVEHNGKKHIVGTVQFQTKNSLSNYRVEWKDDRFTEHFLSMRPFKCLEGTKKYWCRVGYPYPINRRVSPDDLTDLEYDTMFIWKGATEYGINMWNGVYYKLEIVGDTLVGKINEIDMDKLSAPPEEGNLRPVENHDLEPGEPESHWLPTLLIQ